ncbi:MAG: anti-sigma factor family protein [Burkholderiales bacterium]
MSESSFTEAELQGYVDGRLPEGRRAEVEAYLAAHPEEAARIATYQTQTERLREVYAPVLDEAVPQRLALAVVPRRWRLVRVAAAFAWIAVGVATGWQLHTFFGGRAAPAAETPIARTAAIAHVTYSPEVRHPVEVGADQESHLVAWLSKRLGAKVRAPNLESAGYSLIGGRLLPGESGPVAQFMYQCKQGTRVTLYVRTEMPEHEETAFRYSDEGNVRVFYWIDRTFGYAVSSADIGKDVLYKVANIAYAQLNP